MRERTNRRLVKVRSTKQPDGVESEDGEPDAGERRDADVEDFLLRQQEKQFGF